MTNELDYLIADLDAQRAQYRQGYYRSDTNRKMVVVLGFNESDMARYKALYPTLESWAWNDINGDDLALQFENVDSFDYVSGVSFAEPLTVLSLDVFTATAEGLYALEDLRRVFGPNAITSILEYYGVDQSFQETLEFVTKKVAERIINDYYEIYS